MTQYEYTQLQLHHTAYDSIMDLLNEHGADGWEVVLESATGDYTCYLLKREKQENIDFNEVMCQSVVDPENPGSLIGTSLPASFQPVQVGTPWDEEMTDSQPWRLTKEEVRENTFSAELLPADMPVMTTASVETILRRRYEDAERRGSQRSG